jgi:hypothetical protein
VSGASRAAVLATVSVLAPLVFWATVLVGGALRGGLYSHATQAISELSVGTNASVVDAGFIAYGLLTVWFALGLRSGAPSPIGVGFLLLAVAGASTAALGVQWLVWVIWYGEPVVAAPPDARGLTIDPLYDVIHNVLAGWAYATGAVGAMSVGVGVRASPRWRASAPYFVLTGVAVVALAIFIEAADPLYDGALQRTLVVLLQLWPAAYAIGVAVRPLVAGTALAART